MLDDKIILGFETSCDETAIAILKGDKLLVNTCLLYTSPSPRDMRRSRMPSSA